MMSYVYITLLRFRAAMLVNMGMFILVLAKLSCGIWEVFVWSSQTAAATKRATEAIAACSTRPFTEAAEYGCLLPDLLEARWPVLGKHRRQVLGWVRFSSALDLRQMPVLIVTV